MRVSGRVRERGVVADERDALRGVAFADATQRPVDRLLDEVALVAAPLGLGADDASASEQLDCEWDSSLEADGPVSIARSRVIANCCSIWWVKMKLALLVCTTSICAPARTVSRTIPS